MILVLCPNKQGFPVSKKSMEEKISDNLSDADAGLCVLSSFLQQIKLYGGDLSSVTACAELFLDIY